VLHKAHLLEQASMVIPPYLAIGGLLLFLAIIFVFVKLPEIQSSTETKSGSRFKLMDHPTLLLGVIAQFFYVGAQTGLDATFLSYTREVTGLSLYDATTYLGLILGCFFIGRVAGTTLMSFMAPAKLLGLFSLCIVVLLVLAATVSSDPGASKNVVAIPSWLGLGPHLVFTSHIAPYYFMGMKFCMSIMFPTIFSLALRNLGEHTKIGSSLLVMSIVGGALVPLVMGYVADVWSSYKPCLWVVALCMFPVALFALKTLRDEKPLGMGK